MWSKSILTLLSVTLFLFLNGCGEQGNRNFQSNPTSESQIKSVVVNLSLQEFGNTGSNKSLSRSTRASLPNLVQFRVIISSEGLEDSVYVYDSNATSARITLLVGHIYTATLAALNAQGEVFAEGSSDIDLSVAPENDEPKSLKIGVTPVNVGNISVSVIPENGSNILNGQQIYFYLNQPGSIFYSINDEPYIKIENVPSTVGQVLTPQNGQMVSISATAGTTVSIKYQGESLVTQADGSETTQLGALNQSSYQVIQLTQVKPYIDSQARGPLMTSANFGVAQILPLHK
ncbi:MAG: hypothetical protein KC646_05655 [Candidatus Cloacimonetes bacterium]|nr:hypothetical protein [Candidatus Cloacimonadota bacterium]